MSTAYFDLSSGSLQQDWTNTSLIGTNDDWSGVPSITGYLGDIDAASPTGVDPRTRTAAALGAVDVIANLTATGTSAGGVAEFQITNPTVALQGSATADAPSLVLHLNASGREDVRVRFDARDIDATVAGGVEENAIQPIAVQYRVDPAGEWINVAYDADVTSLGATEVTPFDVLLPAAAGNQPTLQVRILTTNAFGSDEWVGIDNIVVSSEPASGGTIPVLAIDDVTVSEDGGEASFTVSLSEAATDTVTVEYGTSDGTALAGSDYTTASATLSFAPGEISKTITVPITDDVLAGEGNETFGVTLSNPVNATIGDGSGLATIQDDDITAIYDIQGSGLASALAGQTVTTRGVVTAIDSNGFYLQDVTGDGDAATSDGIFVFTSAVPSVELGALVEVAGLVTEFVPNGAVAGSLSLTELVATAAGAVTIVEDASTAPDVVSVQLGGIGGRLPPTESLNAGIAFYESLEGMLVTVKAATATGPTNGFGEIFTVVDDGDPSNGYSATGLTDRGNLLIARGAGDFGDSNTVGGDFNPERIQIDDDSGVLAGFTSPKVNVGARLGDVTGVVGYEFGNYQVTATQAYTVTQPSLLVKETGTLHGSANQLLVASYNAENLDPTDGQARFDLIADEILASLNAPDIVALQEIQDGDGPGNAAGSSVVSAAATLQQLVDALNAAAPVGVEYAFVDNPFIGDDTNGGEPGGNIRTSFLYHTDRVAFDPASLATIGADGNPVTGPDTDQQTNPDNPFYGSRPPLVATFTFNGKDVTIVNNHFSSKGGSEPLLGTEQPPLNSGEVQRAAQAQAVNSFVDGLLAQNANAKVIVAGDLNEFPFEEPMQVVKGLASITDYDVTGGTATATFTAGGTQILSDLMDTLPEGERFDYVFEGNSQTLDHILVSQSLEGSAEFDVVHINSEFADQTSDHDPLIARFTIEADEPVTILEQADSTLAGSIDTPIGTDELETSTLGTYTTGSGTGSAEVIAHEASSDRLFVMNNVTDRIEIVDFSNPASPVKTGEIDVAALVPGYDATADGSGMNSIAISNGILAVAIEAPTKSDPGVVALFSTADGSLIKTLTVGSLPDMLTFTPDGTKLIVANEGENPGAGEVESAGSVSLIDLSGGAADATVVTVGFEALDGREGELRDAGVRLFAGTTASTGLEPEYITISPDGTTAYVTLQENNAVARYDITGTAPVLQAILPLGYVDHSLAGNEGDFSDRDGPGTGGSSLGAINIVTAPIKGMLMPDGVKSWTVEGVTYFATANEGDSRVDGSDEARLSAVDLNDAVFGSSEAQLKSEDYAGRLTISNIDGNTDPATAGLEDIYTFGGRSMTIFRQNADGSITKVADTGGEFEKIIASLPNSGTAFNQNGEGTGASFDTRSDNKAGEPEGIEIGRVGDKTYAFIGLERQGGVMVYDVTDPTSPSYVKYLEPTSQDRGPEILKFIAAEDSPTGENLLLTANEYSGTVTTYQIDEPAPETFRLQILHASDFEAGLNAVDRAGNFAAIVDYLEDTQENSITLSSGDNFQPSPFFSAGSDASLKEIYETALETHYGLAPGSLNISPGFGTADISMLDIIGVQASAIGNHEFDTGTNPLAAIMRQTAGFPGAQFPYLSANLDFSGDPNLNPLYTSQIRDASDFGGFPPAVGVGAANKKIAPATIITENGEKIGVVGATTQLVENISSTGGVQVIGTEANDMAALAAVIQPTIDALIAQGINKIILVSHLQQIAFEKALAPLLHGVDVIVSGGSNTLLADSEDVARGLRPGDSADDTYPIVTQNADGKTALIVNTDGEYSYVGRLVVDFDANGDIIADSVDPNVSGAYATTDEQVDALYANPIDIDGDGDVDADPFAEGTRGDLVNDIAKGVGGIIDAQDGNLFGKSSVYLEGRRGEVRTEETNLGNLSADANLWYAQKADDTVLVSIKNGGGIRDSIGRVEAVGGTSTELPPGANPDAGKAEGDISQLDIANSLRFNNALSLITLTPEQLLQVLEHAVAAVAPGATPGQFAQLGGISYSYDASLPAGQRVQSAALIDENGDATRALVQDGELVAGAPASIRLVTLSFLLTGGDGYPFQSFVTANPTFADVVNLSPDLVPDAGQTANFAAEGTEQDAFAEFLDAFYSETAYAELDTTQANDTRIQNLGVRQDTVFEGLLPGVDAVVATGPGLVGGAGRLTVGQTVTLTLTLSRAIDPADAAGLTLSLNDRGTATLDLAASDATHLVFKHRVAPDQIASDLVVTSVNLNGATVTDEFGNAIDFDTAEVNPAGILQIDGYTGSSAAETFRGTTGAETFRGRAGSDTYIVNNAGDRTIEAANAGTDTVRASVDVKLPSNVERVVLTGSKDIDASGNNLGNTMIGNNGDNVLSGGLGRDKLEGNGGSDTFLFDTVPGLDHWDYIRDFNRKLDTIALDDRIFRALEPGILDKDQFKDIGRPGAKVDADDRILYNSETGGLHYDSNGSKAGGREFIAALDTKPYINHEDILVV